MARNKQGVNYIVTDNVDGSIVVNCSADNDYSACYGTAISRLRENQIMTVIEPKSNIDYSVEDIKKYLALIAKTGVFMDITFDDSGEEKYTFTLKTDTQTDKSLYLGTLTLIRYLYGGGDENDFCCIVKNFIRLCEENPELDTFMMLQLAHNDISNYVNIEHCLMGMSFKPITSDQVVRDTSSVHKTYSGTNGESTFDKVKILDFEVDKLLEIIKKKNE